jgi:hypothetical protein
MVDFNGRSATPIKKKISKAVLGLTLSFLRTHTLHCLTVTLIPDHHWSRTGSSCGVKVMERLGVDIKQVTLRLDRFNQCSWNASNHGKGHNGKQNDRIDEWLDQWGDWSVMISGHRSRVHCLILPIATRVPNVFESDSLDPLRAHILHNQVRIFPR